jgi:2-polyprenyl-3-methyl-5-hydroxy-6-metoxy-1,4-benzoquinol methylase
MMEPQYFINREKCPGCAAGPAETIYRHSFLEPPLKDFLGKAFAEVGRIEFDYLAGATYILQECGNCGLIYQQQIPDGALIKKFYEEWIDPAQTFANHEQSDNLPHLAQYAHEVMLAINYFNVLPARLKFLDFGMGWAKWCRMAKAFGCDAYGTDLSAARMAYAQSQGIKAITWDEIGAQRFDFINMNQVLEHLAEPQDTLRYLRAALKPGGLIKICVPDGRGVKQRLQTADWLAPLGSKNSLEAVIPLAHLNCFCYESLIKVAGLAGLKPVKIPIRVQFTAGTHWQPLKPLLKNIFRPIYRNMWQKSTYLFFRPSPNS